MDELLTENTKSIVFANSVEQNSKLEVAMTSKEIDIYKCFKKASKQIAPCWDNRDYVAVNPFFGFKDTHISKTFQFLKEIYGKSIFPKKEFFLNQYNQGLIENSDIEFAINTFEMMKSDKSKNSLASIKKVITHLYSTKNEKVEIKIKSISDFYDQDNKTAITEKISHEMSSWLSAYFDEGQAFWIIKSNKSNLFKWWKNLVIFDKPLKELKENFKNIILSLPDNRNEALFYLSNIVIEKFNFNEDQLSNYFYRLLFSNLGWASFIKHFEFEFNRNEKSKNKNNNYALIDILLIRLTYDISLINYIKHKKINPSSETDNDTNLDLILLNASEHAYRKKIIHQIKANQKTHSIKTKAQMVFCIDVRSEPIRRHIEGISNQIQTFGFAGFFGLNINYQGLGHAKPDQHSPILLEPQKLIKEFSKDNEYKLVSKKRLFAQKHHFESLIKNTSLSSFSFVETLGISFISHLINASFARKKTNINLLDGGLNKRELDQVKLDLSDIALNEKIQLTTSILKNLSLTENFSKYIFIIGHGSESANNPYSSALECGACGGHHGGINSRILTNLLNDNEVRKGLVLNGISIPRQSIFIAGSHNTTTEEIHLELSDEQKTKKEIIKYVNIFQQASHNTRVEKSKYLPWCNSQESHDNLKSEFVNKSKDWSEVRPEWGLARNASFIIAPRKLTRLINFEGRSFLHDYDCKQDHDLSILETLMTAPMIVTNWINMQYYASTIDPIKFGAGNKTLNNVVGLIGCIQGGQSDLLTGLTEQSVWYKGKYFHEPLRLQVLIQAEPNNIQKIIDKHKLLQDLIYNEWIKLISIDPSSLDFKILLNNKWILLGNDNE